MAGISEVPEFVADFLETPRVEMQALTPLPAAEAPSRLPCLPSFFTETPPQSLCTNGLPDANDGPQPLALKAVPTFQLLAPSKQPGKSQCRHGQVNENARLHVHKIFITDDFKGMMPSYLSFVKAVTYGDYPLLDTPMEMLQQHKVLKVIRKLLDTIMGTSNDKHTALWPEFPTNIKLSVTKDTASLAEYIERMKDKQEHIFYMASGSADEVEILPSVERLPRRGYKALFPTEATEVHGLPELEGRKLQDVTVDGPSNGGGSRLAFLLTPPLADEDGTTRTEYQEDRLLVILGQPFARA